MKKFLILMIAFVAALLLLAVVLPGEPGEKRALPRDPRFNSVTGNITLEADRPQDVGDDYVRLLYKPTVEIPFDQYVAP